jgi:acyl-CoA thioesterase
MANTPNDTKSQATGPHRFHMDGWISCAPFERLLNIKIAAAADGQATLTLPFLIDYAQGAGLMHGGALVSLADTAVVMAIKSLVPPLTHFATISLEAKFLAPVKQGTVTAKAEVTSRKGAILQGRATIFDEQHKAVLEFHSTFKIAANAEIRGITFDVGASSASVGDGSTPEGG